MRAVLNSGTGECRSSVLFVVGRCVPGLATGRRMSKRASLAFLTVLVLAVGVTVWTSSLHQRLLRAATAPKSSITPVSLHYIRETNDDGSLIDHPAFWVTNHTGKTLSVDVTSVEIRTGLTWAPLPNPPVFVGMLDFTNGGGIHDWLPPHAAGCGRVGSRLNLPADCAWRARAIVHEQRVGVGDMLARIRLQQRVVRIRLSGTTNVQLNAFRKDIRTWRTLQEVISEGAQP